MAVNDADAQWGLFKPERDRVASFIAGKAEAVAYVRRLPGWEPDQYALIQEGAYFLPMVGRTLETFSGLVFLKSPARTFPEGLEEFTDDVTQSGQEIDRFAEASFDAVMATGALAILVDYPQAPAGLTKLEAEEQGFRPNLKLYDGNTILSARVAKRGGALQLVKARVLEAYEEEGADEFTFETKPQVRVLDLDGAGNYRQRVFRVNKDGQWGQFGEAIEPRMNNAPLKEIPLFFSNTRDNEPRPEKPPMADLAEVNSAHLNNSAQAEWSYAWLGSPMLFGKGFKLPAGSKIKMGSSEAIVVPGAAGIETDLKIVQAGADAVGALKTAMDDKRRDAASLGARMLMETPKAAIAAETARIERAGEQSVVGAAANAVSQCVTNALRFLAKWAGLPEVVRVGDGDTPLLYWLNTDLLPTRMDPAELEALLSAWMAGALSKRELFARFQEAEVVDPAKSFEDHEDEIAEEPPPMATLTAPAQPGAAKPKQEPA